MITFSQFQELRKKENSLKKGSWVKKRFWFLIFTRFFPALFLSISWVSFSAWLMDDRVRPREEEHKSSSLHDHNSPPQRVDFSYCFPILFHLYWIFIVNFYLPFFSFGEFDHQSPLFLGFRGYPILHNIEVSSLFVKRLVF